MVMCAKMPLMYLLTYLRKLCVLQGRITAAFFVAQSNTTSRLNMGISCPRVWVASFGLKKPQKSFCYYSVIGMIEASKKGGVFNAR